MLRSRIRKHPLAAFVLVAFGWSWSWDALYYLLDWGAVLPVSLGRQWGLPMAALVVVWAGDVPVRDWLGRVFAWRLHPGLYLLVLFLPLFVDNVQPVVRALGGGSLSYAPPASLPVVVLFVLGQTLLLGGTEEIGWRGFLQPRLQESTSVLTAGLAVGVLWLVWHFPLFLAGDGPYSFAPDYLVPYALTILGVSVVFGVVVNLTDGSVLPVMLMHGTSNLGALLAGSGGVLDGTGLVDVVGVGFWWLLVLVLVVRYGRTLVPTTTETSTASDVPA